VESRWQVYLCLGARSRVQGFDLLSGWKVLPSNFRLVATYHAYDDQLGIKKVQWSPSGQFLALGSYDQKCRLLNYYTWKPLIEFNHPKQLTPSDIVNLINIRQSTRKSITQPQKMRLHGSQGSRYSMNKSSHRLTYK
jgi:WD40 repeat protein